MTSTYSKACQAFDLGIMGTSCKADAVVEIEILKSKDSSDWKLYPNGFRHQEIYRLLIDCKLIQGNSAELKDTVRMIFSLNSADYYDSLGNYRMSICGDIMHTGNEFKFQKGDKFIAFVQRNPLNENEWWLLRAEKMNYNEALSQYQVSRMINNYLQQKSSKRIDSDFLQKNKIFYSVVKSQDSVETIVFYNPYSSRLALIRKDTFIESDSLIFDYSPESFKIDKKFFVIRSRDNWIKLNNENLQKIK
jgi:hypothetical protein